jgi:hypothetical protein
VRAGWARLYLDCYASIVIGTAASAMAPMHKVLASQLQSAAKTFSRFSATRPELVQTCAGAITWCGVIESVAWCFQI